MGGSSLIYLRSMLYTRGIRPLHGREEKVMEALKKTGEEGGAIEEMRGL